MKDCSDCKGCAVCENNHKFELDKDLVTELLDGNIAIFAGAGISTESRSVLKFTLYDSIAGLLEIKNCKLSFPELMQKLCDKPNGRIKLINEINDRFKVIDSFPEMHDVATRFHKELSTLHPVNTIVTTNWDTYFEDKCNAIPFVADTDLAFWNVAKRKVLKIHGSINNYGSLIASLEDYSEREKSLNSGVIGALLKTILSTQTVIFIGYSFGDSDFNTIYSAIKDTMKEFHRQAYVVTPFEKERKKFEGLGLIPIITDGTYFLSEIKKHAVSSKVILDDKIYKNIKNLLNLILDEHSKLHDNFELETLPEIIYTVSYQDGMIHALQRALKRRTSGEYSNPCHLKSIINSYIEIQEEKEKDSIFEDEAYIEGYINALTFILLDESERHSDHPPLYYVYGLKYDLDDYKSFKKVSRKISKVHRKAHLRALKHVKSLKHTQGIVFHHPPWL